MWCRYHSHYRTFRLLWSQSEVRLGLFTTLSSLVVSSWWSCGHTVICYSITQRVCSAVQVFLNLVYDIPDSSFASSVRRQKTPDIKFHSVSVNVNQQSKLPQSSVPSGRDLISPETPRQQQLPSITRGLKGVLSDLIGGGLTASSDWTSRSEVLLI